MKIFCGVFAGLAVGIGMVGMFEEVAPHHHIYGGVGWGLALGFGLMILGGLIGNAAER